MMTQSLSFMVFFSCVSRPVNFVTWQCDCDFSFSVAFSSCDIICEFTPDSVSHFSRAEGTNKAT